MIEWITNNQVTATFLVTALAALATIVYAILTFILVKETIELRKVETEPEIIIYLEVFEANFLNIIIKNIGNGPALNITFSFDRTHQLSTLEFSQGTNINHIQLFNGLSYMAPGHATKFFFASVKELQKPEQIPALDMTISYKSKGKHEYKQTFKLAISEFIGLRWIGDDPIKEIRKSLESINENLAQINNGKRINVDVYHQNLNNEDFLDG